MEIMKKIEDIRQKIKAGDVTLADDIASDGKEAIFAGIRDADGEVTPEWEKMMKHFKNNDKELARLCGKDQDFNNSDWGLMSLAYIAGNSLCTTETIDTTGTRRGMTDAMKETVDKEY